MTTNYKATNLRCPITGIEADDQMEYLEARETGLLSKEDVMKMTKGECPSHVIDFSEHSALLEHQGMKFLIDFRGENYLRVAKETERIIKESYAPWPASSIFFDDEKKK